MRTMRTKAAIALSLITSVAVVASTVTTASEAVAPGITVAGAVQTTKITGDIGTFPTPTITGLGNIVLNGVNQGANAVTQQAKMDLVTAYNSAAGRAPTSANPAVATAPVARNARRFRGRLIGRLRARRRIHSGSPVRSSCTEPSLAELEHLRSQAS